MSVFEKIEKLPEDVKEFFHSNEVRLAMEQACFLYDIAEEDIEELAKPVGNIFFKDVQLHEMPLVIQQAFEESVGVTYGISYELNSKIFSKFPEYFVDSLELLKKWETLKMPSIISEEDAWKKVLEIEPWILEQEKEEKVEQKKQQDEVVKQQAKIDKLALAKALEKYPNLGEQAITSNPLKLRYFPTPVKSSIKNWITDYHDALGAGKHETMDRGNYLFHSENGKKLTPFERQKVSLVLKSLDEEMPLDIDGQAQKIVFEVPVEKPVERREPVRETLVNENGPIVGMPIAASRSVAQPFRENLPVMETPRAEKIENPINENFASRKNPSEDVAQARIRQSLNFSNFQNPQTAKKENPASVFNFEDSDYAKLQKKNDVSPKPAPRSDFETYFGANRIDETQKPVFGSFSFSSAQKLPVEKNQETPQQGFASPQPQVRVEPTGNVKTWNSPDFKNQILQGNSTPKRQGQPMQNNVQENGQTEKPTSKTEQVYSPYFIRPMHSYNGNGNINTPPVASQDDPKIKGNMVDLS